MAPPASTGISVKMKRVVNAVQAWMMEGAGGTDLVVKVKAKVNGGARRGEARRGEARRGETWFFCTRYTNKQNRIGLSRKRQMLYNVICILWYTGISRGAYCE